MGIRSTENLVQAMAQETCDLLDALAHASGPFRRVAVGYYYNRDTPILYEVVQVRGVVDAHATCRLVIGREYPTCLLFEESEPTFLNNIQPPQFRFTSDRTEILDLMQLPLVIGNGTPQPQGRWASPLNCPPLQIEGWDEQPRG